MTHANGVEKGLIPKRDDVKLEFYLDDSAENQILRAS